MTLHLAFFIGFFGRLSALTAPAATAWAVYLSWLKIERPLSLIGSLAAVAIFTVLAVVELVADKLPQTPSRTVPPGLIARIVMGGLTGACVAVSGAQEMLIGVVFGAVGGVVGCFLGYRVRTGLCASAGHSRPLRRLGRRSGDDRWQPMGSFAVVALNRIFITDVPVGSCRQGDRFRSGGFRSLAEGASYGRKFSNDCQSRK